MSTLVEFENDAREKLLRGVDTLARAVRSTLGPKGRTVLIRRQFGRPQICNDGVTVAKAVEPEDLLERTGAEVVREAAVRTGDLAGDGTTTSTILAHCMIREGVKAVAAGLNPMDIQRGMDMAIQAAVAGLQQQARPVAGQADIERVGTISANGDATIGRMIAEAIQKVGKEGGISIEEAKSMETELDIVEGLQFDRGYISPYFVTDPEGMLCELDHPYVLLLDRKMSGLQPVVQLLEAVVQQGGALVIVAEDFEPDVLATLVVNKLRAGLRVVAVKAPGFGERRKAMLEDIAIVTGGQVISADTGLTLEKVTIEMLGQARLATVTKDTTTLVSGAGDPKRIAARCAELRHEIDDSKSDYDTEQLQQRLAKLSGGVAVVRVGGATELEVKERKDRVDDAIHATRAALDEGLVPGGGVAFLYARLALDALEPASDDQRVGIDIVRKALAWPTHEIAVNAGADGSLIVGKLLESIDRHRGYDAQNGRFIDMLEAGIVDPVKVQRLALQNAGSVAGLFITSNVLVVEKPEAPGRPGLAESDL